MTRTKLAFFAGLLTSTAALAADQKVAIRFQAMVGKDKFACGQTYTGIGTTGSKIAPRDFRYYVHNVRLVDNKGGIVPVQLDQSKWQLDDTALLDFEDGTWSCVNGTRETNDQVLGTVPAGTYTGLLFTVGVPFNKNHTELTSQPPPLNLTALSWVWNAGRKFARLDFASAGQPHGFTVHLGSTGCMPNDTKITVPTQCSAPNRPEIRIDAFNPDKDSRNCGPCRTAERHERRYQSAENIGGMHVRTLTIPIARVSSPTSGYRLRASRGSPRPFSARAITRRLLSLCARRNRGRRAVSSLSVGGRIVRLGA